MPTTFRTAIIRTPGRPSTGSDARSDSDDPAAALQPKGTP